MGKSYAPYAFYIICHQTLILYLLPKGVGIRLAYCLKISIVNPKQAVIGKFYGTGISLAQLKLRSKRFNTRIEYF